MSWRGKTWNIGLKWVTFKCNEGEMGLDIVLPPPVFMSLRLMQYIKDGKIFKKACFCLTFWVKCAPQIPWTNTLLSYKRVNSS